MATCEDYPCCGHTDGLGCDWVSPNEVVPCDVCIEARASFPYHSQTEGCKTQRAQAQNSVPTDANCTDCQYDNVADIMVDGEPVCFECEAEMAQHDREMQEQYDGTWGGRSVFQLDQDRMMTRMADAEMGDY